MNAINRKTISIGLLNLGLPLLVILFIQTIANAQTFQLDGTWEMYSDKTVKFDKQASISQNGGNLSINNGYGSNSTAVLNGNNLTTSDGLKGRISADGMRINWSNKFVWLKQTSTATNPNLNNPQTLDLNGNWAMFEGDGKKYDNPAVIKQNGTSVTLNNGYGGESTVNLEGSKINVRAWKLTGTVTADGNRIDWSNGFYWTKNSAPTTADSGTIKRTITIKNNSGFSIIGGLKGRVNYDDPNNKDDIRTSIGQTPEFLGGQTETINGSFQTNTDIEFWIRTAGYKPLFKSTLPKNKDVTNFCYEVTGTYFVPIIKTCDGSPTYESKHISFKNEAGYNSVMSLTYYPTDGSTTKTATTLSTTPGYQTKLYLPLDADTDKPMTLKVSKEGFSTPLLDKSVSLSNFEADCYKVWGSFITAKISPCSLNPSARKIKLWNNAGYTASVSVTYYDKDSAGKDVAKTVKTNPIEVTQTETIEVPNGTSPTPIKINFINHWKSGIPFTTMTATADFTGELCYKVEGISSAPTAATCDDTVGDTTGETRQIRFQNDAGYDAQLIVTYFVDEVINGQTMSMPKSLSTGMINGLGGKFRLVTIPKNTSKGMPITISLQGSTTVKNDIFSTTLPADFAASPQPCFKVTGTLFDPSGGKCNQ
jgi:hypothetical protein